MANQFRYLPMLRSKTGEATALQNLSAAAKARLFPIVHVVQKPPAGFADSIIQSWSGLPLALDGTFHVDATGSTTTFTQLFDKIGRGKVSVVPSIEYGATAQYLTAVRNLIGKYGTGLALKVKPNQISAASSWVATQGWKSNEIDLIITLFDVAGFDVDLLEPAVTQALLKALQQNHGWRSVTLSAAAAPKDHGGLPQGRSDIPRRDWELWQKVAPKMPFNLDYGDYCTSNPDLEEPPGLAMVRATVSVRYTLDQSWIVLKGRPTKGNTGQPMERQYRAHARTLVSDPQFGGLTGCWGDQRIQQIASGAPGAGNRTTWVSIAVNRHMSLVADRLP